jgi:hypothetical protein
MPASHSFVVLMLISNGVPPRFERMQPASPEASCGRVLIQVAFYQSVAPAGSFVDSNRNRAGS